MIKHKAPPVVYPLGRSLVRVWILAGFWLTGLLVTLLWFMAVQLFDWRICLAIFALVAAGLAAFADWKNAPSGQLVWDGDLWFWESSAYQSGLAEQQLSVIADFQQVLLLRIQNQANASLWLWLERKTMPERWLDLRRAVYSTHKTSSQLTYRHPGASDVPLRDPLQADLLQAMAVSNHVQTTDSSPVKQ